MEKANLKPEDVWFCGDTYDKDVEGAKEAGLSAVFYQGLTNGHARQARPSQELNDKDVPVITDWKDLIEILKNIESK